MSDQNRKMIYLDDAIDALQKEINKGIPPFDDVMGSIRCGVRLARNIIEDLPSVQPGIIHCKDCIYYKWEIDMCDYPYSTAHNVVHEYDYCSKAERKTNESD